MDNYIVSARKYRPSTFRSVVGQDALTTTLRNAIAGNKLAHAYLFAGPRGVGKTTCARIFAKTINCLNLTPEHEACNKCESCVAFNEQRSYNIHELDAASNNSVDDIRTLIDQVRVPPQIGKYKVYIIDEVHMLSTAAFNSFLKTLEEPPAHAIFILATTEKHKIIPTILSRCQVYDFNRITVSDMVNHLQYVANQENITTEPEALNIIAQKADGGMRDALSIFDQTVSYTAGNVTYKSVIQNLNVLDFEYFFQLTDAIIQGNVTDCLLILNDILNRGFEGQYIISGITSHFRDLLVCKDAVTATLFEVGASIRERYIDTAKRCDTSFLYQAIEIANDCDLQYRLSKNKRLLLELTLIKLCQLPGNNATGTISSEKKNEIKPITPSEKKSPAPENKKVENISGEPASKPYQTPEMSAEKTESAPKPTKATVNVAPNLGISLSSLQKGEAPTESTTKPEADAKRNSLFSEEQLLAAWNTYGDSLNEEKLLKNTMNFYKPKMVSDSIFQIEVGSEINKNYLDENSSAILTFLQNTLQNDDISMTILITEANATKKALTPRDLFDEMAQQNPSLQKLSDELGLELI